jgi:predicted nucleotidyltransferase
MGIIKEQYTVDSAFLKEPWKELTYSDIKKITKKKSKSFVYNALKRLVKEKIISSKAVGKSILYQLNLSSSFVQNYYGFLSEYKLFNEFEKIPLQLLENIRSKIPTKFFSLLVAGSYAKKTETKKSDLDICIIVGENENPKKILAEISHEAETSIPPIHAFVFTKKDFLEMITNNEENYGKEVVRNNFIFYGGSSYYEILNEAIKHGFRG